MTEPTRIVRPKRRRRPKPARSCYYCKLPISDDEVLAIPAMTGNAWAHFECWYDGPDGWERDPKTGKLLSRESRSVGEASTKQTGATDE
jgi:hypothetical protein